MLRKYSDLNEMAKDALRELGNIGTGNAATALSAMTNQEIDLEIPVIRIVPYQDAPGLLGGAEIVETGILLEVSLQPACCKNCSAVRLWMSEGRMK